ncbi:MAG: hypothetical protein EZS28_023420 [Streblomastix strix]|uniref:GRIP-related Arf-binding domain-containing protein n=1 Tax=Streblomastix strix TaxID=222440 RepID=A0A5J4VF14_9EUKA|nr:MAG: hypothetical protein EZS28_023420 [Streblomastix strix]
MNKHLILLEAENTKYKVQIESLNNELIEMKKMNEQLIQKQEINEQQINKVNQEISDLRLEVEKSNLEKEQQQLEIKRLTYETTETNRVCVSLQQLLEKTRKDADDQIRNTKVESKREIEVKQRQLEDSLSSIKRMNDQIMALQIEASQSQHLREILIKREQEISKAEERALFLEHELSRASALSDEKDENVQGTIDKNVVTSLILSYFCRPTAAQQTLQIMSRMLGWNEEQRKKVGIQRNNNIERSKSQNKFITQQEIKEANEKEKDINFIENKDSDDINTPTEERKAQFINKPNQHKSIHINFDDFDSTNTSGVQSAQFFDNSEIK